MTSVTIQAGGQHEHHERRWAAMTILLLAGFMNLIDVTIVNVALPSMQKGLGATSSGIEWVVAAYICAFAISLLPFGRLGDMLGRRKVFLAGIACFSIASAMCGMAPTIETLVAARILQGVSGAMMTPQTLAIAQVIFPIHERAAAFSLFGLTAGLASVAGPLVGGLLIDADIYGLGWRPIFLVNVPVGVLAIVAGLRFIPSMKGNRDVGIDKTGIGIATLALLLVIFPLVEGRNFGWPLWCFAMMALSVPAAFAFVRWQAFQASRGQPQLLPVSLLANRQFLGGSFLVALFFSGVPGFFMVLAVFLQSGFGLDPLHSGLTTIPFPFGVLVASVIAGRLGARLPRQRIFVGSFLLVGAMLWLKHLATTIGAEFHSIIFLPALAMGGFGLGTAVSPLFQSVLSSVEGRDAGSASGGLQSFQQLGAALGVAVMGQIFFSRLPTGAGDMHPGFVSALEAAMIYGCITFAMVGLAALLLKPPRMAKQEEVARELAVEAA